ncbi:hypothetical protein [Acetobacter sp.]|uniref:hypothetical protein n=1 Tax=Acetobacter sp. TaxID=440 RepID=UPI00259097E5|nr:hypothetical protein [Acetobacter sp.]MCC6104717.1 hypothetical protein [Acetobacter sp.]
MDALLNTGGADRTSPFMDDNAPWSTGFSVPRRSVPPLPDPSHFCETTWPHKNDL